MYYLYNALYQYNLGRKISNVCKKSQKEIDPKKVESCTDAIVNAAEKAGHSEEEILKIIECIRDKQMALNI